MARPSKYDEVYCQTAIEYMSKGKSITQLARHIGVSKSTVYLWVDNHAEFSDALTRGRELSQAHWEDELEVMMYSKEVNAPLVKLYFANRFGWHDKAEVDHKSSDTSMSPSFDESKYKAAQDALKGKLG